MGKNIYNELSSVCQDRAHYSVIFLSEHYARKWLPDHERESARARAFVEKNREHILTIRLDDTEIPGFLMTVGYLDSRSMTIEQIYRFRTTVDGCQDTEKIQGQAALP